MPYFYLMHLVACCAPYLFQLQGVILLEMRSSILMNSLTHYYRYFDSCQLIGVHTRNNKMALLSKASWTRAMPIESLEYANT